MRKSLLVLAVMLMAFCIPSAVMANFDTFNITAELGVPITLALDANLIDFGVLGFGGGVGHAAIPAATPIVVTVTGTAAGLYDVLFDGTIFAPAANYAVQMDEGTLTENFIVNLTHDSTNTLDGTGNETFNINATIPLNALRDLTIAGAYAPAALVEIRVDYQ